MINESSAKKFCKDDISKIENYDKAINDQTEPWECHHRDEIRILPSGMTVVRSAKDLKDAGRYYNCPANELIFLTKSEHSRLHSMNKSDEQKQKLSEAMKGEGNPMYGKPCSDETRRKISEAKKGKTISDETRRKISEANKGKHSKPHSDETKRKISEAMKGKPGLPHSDETKKKLSEASRAAWARRKANA